MKKVMTVVVLALVGQFAFAAEQVNCRSFQKVEGWDGAPTNDYLYLTLNVKSDTKISDIRTKGAYLATAQELDANIKWVPKAKKYEDTNLFASVEDAWHNLAVLLPKNVSTLEGRFKAFVFVRNEKGQPKATIDLFCN